ncbi:hypothetical protein J6590_083198 [Homalodisca vitripennis]|nr:hypothetical protein J6590_083198 [Homalodisca vitripennis]
MDLFPLEALNIIAENQTLYVLSASSTVNPHCNADTAEYLEAADCRVDPRFESPESEDNTLNRNVLPPTGSTKYNNRELDTIRDNSPHCNADTADYLETAECRVDPRFESPELEESTGTSLYKKAGNKKITIKESLEVPLNKTECRSHIVTQTRQGTWRLRNVGWSRGLSLR